MNEEQHEVLILGAGPAGTAAAIQLAKAGRKVALLDKGEHPYPHLPETHGGFSEQVMQALDLRPLLDACLEAPRPVRFVDVETGAGFTVILEPSANPGEQGLGRQLNRSRFDAGLLERAISLGVRYRPRTKIQDWIREGQILKGVLETHGDRETRHRAALIIDASGKASLLPNLLGLRTMGEKLDARMAVFSHFQNQARSGLFRDRESLIHALSGGYIFASPLPLDRFVIMAVLQDCQASRQPQNPEGFFRAVVDACPPVKAALERSDRVLDYIPVVNKTWSCGQRLGRNYLVIGESANFPDPFYHPGTSLALEEGRLAASFAESLLDGVFAWEDAAALRAWEASFSLAVSVGRAAPVRALGGGSERERFLMACADPHLPWMFPDLVKFARSRYR